ncbi:MAG: N-acetyltransferase [archaeon]|nr:N-acetyltransferase [archaeon]
MELIIREMEYNDWKAVKSVFKEGIATKNATFETNAPEWDKWNISHSQKCRLIAEKDGEVIGWAVLTPISDRCIYSGVAEVSIYIKNTEKKSGVGTILMKELIFESEKEGYWTLQAKIFPENIGSLKLHKNCGFREVGIREKIGQMDGLWRDVILLEKRSSIVGI